MRDGITVTGIVLSVMPIGEYDRRISLLTKERGKLSVFAKGARKPSSALIACTQTFTFGKFTVYPGKSAYNLISADITNYFSELRDNYEWIYRGMYFCEFAEYYTQEGNDETEVLKLLYISLRALSNQRLEPNLIRAVYDLRMIVIEGEGPQISECVKCGCGMEQSEELPERLSFSVRLGGLLCGACTDWDKESVQIHRGTVYALRFICSAPYEKLFSFTLAPDNLSELVLLVNRYRKAYVGHTMKSEELY